MQGESYHILYILQDLVTGCVEVCGTSTIFQSKYLLFEFKSPSLLPRCKSSSTEKPKESSLQISLH